MSDSKSGADGRAVRQGPRHLVAVPSAKIDAIGDSRREARLSFRQIDALPSAAERARELLLYAAELETLARGVDEGVTQQMALLRRQLAAASKG